PIERLTFSSAARDPEAARLTAEFGARLIPPSRLLAPHAIGHALKVNLGPAGKAGAAVAKANAGILAKRKAAPGFGPAAAPGFEPAPAEGAPVGGSSSEAVR
ncbi:MAG: hypothetical protein ACRDJU_06120, partial [Actinomycetota bacterium]